MRIKLWALGSVLGLLLSPGHCFGAREQKIETLDVMIARIKDDPKAQVDLSTHAGRVVDALMAEIKNPALKDDVRRRLIGHLADGNSPKNIAQYQALLHYPDPWISRIAANIVSNNIRKGNEDIALGMLSDSNRNIRVSGVIAFQQLDWKEGYRSTFENLMATDGDEGVREMAAHILGVKKVAASQDALKLALNDRSKRVRESAQSALDEISGKRQADIERDVQEILKRQKKGAPN